MGGEGKEEEQTDLRQGRREQLHNGNVHSGLGQVYVSSPRRRSTDAEKPVVSGGVSQCILERGV